MNKNKSVVSMMILVTLLSGCAGMTGQQQRVLSGGAVGAAAGAAVSGISGGSIGTGAVVGGALGAVGGAVVNELKK